MKPDIVRFIKEVCDEYGMECFYFPDNDVYSLRKNGKGVQNFNTEKFYQLPRSHRRKMILALIKIGINLNLGEKHTREQIHMNQSIGKKIYVGRQN